MRTVITEAVVISVYHFKDEEIDGLDDSEIWKLIHSHEYGNGNPHVHPEVIIDNYES